MDEGLGFGSSSQLGDFWGKIKIKTYFLGEKKTMCGLVRRRTWEEEHCS
jgi:hypothetical protein